MNLNHFHAPPIVYHDVTVGEAIHLLEQDIDRWENADVSHDETLKEFMMLIMYITKMSQGGDISERNLDW